MSATRIDSEALGTLCVCAVRYALGRQSYIAATVARIVATHKRHLPGNDVDVILRGIEEGRRMGRLGMECDAREWERLADELRHMERPASPGERGGRGE